MNTRKTDVVFVFPPAYGNSGVFRGHLGVSYLRTALDQSGISTTQYLNAHPGTIDQVASEIVRLQAPIVGFTAYDANSPLCIALAESIKAKKPGVQVVFGGPTATFNGRRLLEKHSVIDACVIGESEETGADIFARLLDHQPESIQAGFAFRGEGGVVSTPLPPLVGSSGVNHQSSLDVTPSPYLSGILSDGHLGLLTGRGCTHHCQYCCFAALGRRRLRLHSLERVLAELEHIAEQQARSGERHIVPVHDDAFTLLPARAKGLCQAIIDRRLNLVLSCITRADAVDEELIRLMRGAGFVSLAFGLESAVPSVLRATGKVRPPDWHHPDLEPERNFVDQVRQSVFMAKKYGFNVGVSIILGLPTETAADGAETLRFVKQLPIDYYMHNFLWLFPGTPLWETHARYGVACAFNEMGLPITTEYAYDLTKLPPCPKCALEHDANFIRLLTTDAMYGCDAPRPGSKGIATILLHSNEITPAVAEWLKHTLSVGGTLVQVYSRMKRKERSMRLYHDRCMSSDNMVPARHHVQLYRKKSIGKQDAETWQVACAGVDLYRTYKPELVTIRSSLGPAPLVSWSKNHGTDSALCDIAAVMVQGDEIARVADRVKPKQGVSPLRRMPVPPSLAYPGRWLQGKAPCWSLTRIEVDQQGDVRCCRQGEPIGKVGDSRSAMAGRLAKLVRAIEMRRGCDTCAVASCPRCPFPGVSDDLYCKTMKKRGRIQRSLSGISLYSRLPLLVTQHKDRMAAE